MVIFSLCNYNVFIRNIGLLRQWQDMLHLIVKQLQLSETLNKIVCDIKRLEEEIGKVLMGRPPPPVMHNKSDLEKDIDGLKVGLNYRI